jgi:hypothetical protein
MTSKPFSINCGPFAKVKEDCDNFCHNLYLSYAMTECATKMAKVEEEYNQAALVDDEEMMEKKKLELQAYKSSLLLTAHMLAEIDEVST